MQRLVSQHCRYGWIHLFFLLQLYLFKSEGCEETYNGTGGAKQEYFSYPHSVRPKVPQCTFRFNVGRNREVQIRFTEFSLYRREADCFHDYVIIKGSSNESLQGRFCGNNSPPDINYRGDTPLEIILFVDPTKHTTRFKGTFSFLTKKNGAPEKNDIYGFDEPEKIGCGSVDVKNGGSGTIESPNYPELYPEFANCQWYIHSRSGTSIQLKLDQLLLSTNSEDCDNAKLEILNGYNGDLVETDRMLTSSKKLIRYCGDKDSLYPEDLVIKTITNKVLVKLTTKKPSSETIYKRKDYNKPIGFRLEWTEVGSSGNGEGAPLPGIIGTVGFSILGLLAAQRNIAHLQ